MKNFEHALSRLSERLEEQEQAQLNDLLAKQVQLHKAFLEQFEASLRSSSDSLSSGLDTFVSGTEKLLRMSRELQDSTEQSHRAELQSLSEEMGGLLRLQRQAMTLHREELKSFSSDSATLFKNELYRVSQTFKQAEEIAEQGFGIAKTVSLAGLSLLLLCLVLQVLQLGVWSVTRKEALAASPELSCPPQEESLGDLQSAKLDAYLMSLYPKLKSTRRSEIDELRRDLGLPAPE